MTEKLTRSRRVPELHSQLQLQDHNNIININHNNDDDEADYIPDGTSNTVFNYGIGSTNPTSTTTTITITTTTTTTKNKNFILLQNQLQHQLHQHQQHFILFQRERLTSCSMGRTSTPPLFLFNTLGYCTSLPLQHTLATR